MFKLIGLGLQVFRRAQPGIPDCGIARSFGKLAEPQGKLAQGQGVRHRGADPVFMAGDYRGRGEQTCDTPHTDAKKLVRQ